MEFTGERFIPVAENTELSIEHMHRYYAFLNLVKNKTVLDIACGEGYGSAILSQQATSVLGVDIDRECITCAKEKYKNEEYPNLHFQNGDVSALPAKDAEFDMVVSFETIEHVDAVTQKKFLQEIKRVLTRDGMAIISTPDKENYSERYNHVNLFHKAELKRDEFYDLIKSEFKNVVLLGQGFDIVSLITPGEMEAGQPILTVQWHKDKRPANRKYLIAIGSDGTIPIGNLSSIVLETDKSYFRQVDRIVELQNEVEELSAWGLNLDKGKLELEHQSKTVNETLQIQSETIDRIIREKDELRGKNETYKIKQAEEINALSLLLSERKRESEDWKRIAEENKRQVTALTVQLADTEKNNALAKSNHDREVDGKNAALKIQSESLSRLNDANEKLKTDINLLATQLSEKESLNNALISDISMLRKQLNEINGKLLTIYDSDGWKFLQKYYRVKGKMLPENSQRYKLLKKVVNFYKKKQDGTATLSNASLFSEKGKMNGESPFESITKSGFIAELPYFENPDVSIIIPVYNAWEMNRKCILSILENTGDVSYEVIIADDCSSDETKNLSERFKNIHHIRNEENLGFLLNCNKAASEAKGKYIHFLNNDTEVKPGWLSSLVMLMERDTSIGLAGSKLVYPDGQLQEAGGIIWNDASGWNFGHRQSPDLPEFNYVKEVDYISGASILIRANLWKQIGGFDERYAPAYCEDSDISFEIRKRGYKVVYQPQSEVIHYEGYSHGRDHQASKISNIKKYQIENSQKFFEKWRTVLEKDHYPNAENVFRSRDRSSGKKTLLMVDHYVPQFDKDAGSKTTFQYLQLFSAMGLNIKFIGENFYCHQPYTAALQQMGIEVLYGPWYRDNWRQWFLDNKEQFDYIYLNRPHISIQFIDFFKTNSRARILYYGHDLHFLREQKRFEVEKDKSILSSIEKWKEIELNLFEKSDVILTPSVEEMKIIAALSSSYNVRVIRPYIYKSTGQALTEFSERKDILFVGGFNHSPNVDAVLWFIKEVWPPIIKSNSQIRFIVAGSNPPDIIREQSNSRVIVKGYITDHELERLYDTVKLVVVPLRYGAGVKGKTVEAMKHGLPMVTTEVGIEGLPGDYSFLEPTDDAISFADQVLALYNDEKALVMMSDKSVKYIQENFSESAAMNILESIL